MNDDLLFHAVEQSCNHLREISFIKGMMAGVLIACIAFYIVNKIRPSKQGRKR